MEIKNGPALKFFLPIFAFLLSSCAYMRETPSFRERKPELNQTVAEPQDNAISDSEFIELYSSKLGYRLSGDENRTLISEVATWLGTPYRFGGQTRAGADCSGFVRAVYLAVYGIDLARITVNMAQNATRVRRQKLQGGDLVFFKIDKQKISHVGLYLGNGRFVHASTSLGVIISHLEEPYYAKRFAFGGRPAR